MVSIITPVYNCEKFLEECIQSVLNQSFKGWELILVDDCSIDSSASIIEKYASLDSRIKVFSLKENVGAGVARNKGIEIAKKRFIAFLDSDDYWSKNKLQLQIDFMIKENIEFSYTNFIELDKNDDFGKIILPPRKVTSFSLLFNNYIKTLTAIYDTKRIGKIYMPAYRKRQDWGLWFNILNKTEEAYCFSESLAFYRVRKESMSSSKFNLVKHNYWVYKKGLGFSTVKSIYCLMVFFIEHFFVKSKQIVSTNNL